MTEEKCTSVKLETGGFSRGPPVPSRVGQINALSIWALTNGGPSTHEDRMRSSPKDTSVTGGSAKNATHHIAFVRTVKQILELRVETFSKAADYRNRTIEIRQPLTALFQPVGGNNASDPHTQRISIDAAVDVC